jgi:hypothetical protein
MESRMKLSKQSEEPVVDQTGYRSVVESLRYLVNTRPDIGFVVGYVSRFLEDPREDHMVAVTHILRYVAGTTGWRLWYERKSNIEASLIGYYGSDYACDLEKRQSISGVIFFLGDNPITWQSMKPKSVAQSSCEAEYIAAANATCQTLALSCASRN